LKGRVFSGGLTTGSVALSPGERENISSNPVFGFGHININISVYYGDPELITWMDDEEDGFLLGNRFLLFYGEE
jgi:hypothetical protein